MSSVIYPKGKQHFANGDIQWKAGSAQTFKAVLVDLADYTYGAAHEFLSDIPAGARVATATIANPTNALGVMDADDVSFASATGDQSEAIVVYRDTGNAATSELLFYIDAFSSGMPVTPNGGNINVAWDNGASKIAAL